MEACKQHLGADCQSARAFVTLMGSGSSLRGMGFWGLGFMSRGNEREKLWSMGVGI